jgi:hypothetical protein
MGARARRLFRVGLSCGSWWMRAVIQAVWAPIRAAEDPPVGPSSTETHFPIGHIFAECPQNPGQRFMV